MWHIECKGFHFNEDKFTAIVPIWSDYAKQYKMYPVNHVKLTGAIYKWFENDPSVYEQEWHPDNPFSQEKWIQCKFYLCKWEFKKGRNYIITDKKDLSYPTKWEHGEIDSHGFYVPAKQLIPLHEFSDVAYKSEDTRRLEFEYFSTLSIRREI